jgi:hypothetical protein
VGQYPVGSPEREAGMTDLAMSTFFKMHGGIEDVSGWKRVGARIPDEQARNILGVKKNATEKQINEAYKKLAVKFHPDKGGDPKVFQLIDRARNSLLEGLKKAVIPQGPIFLGPGQIKTVSPQEMGFTKGPTLKTTPPSAQQEKMTELLKDAPKAVINLKTNSPQKFNEMVNTLTLMNREDRQLFGQFAEMVEKGSRASMGEAGLAVERVTKEIFGQDRPMGNKGLKNILDWMVKASDELKASEQIKPTIKVTAPPPAPVKAAISGDINTKLSSLGYEKDQISRLSLAEKQKIAKDMTPPFLHKSASPTVKVKGQKEAIKKIVEEDATDGIINNTRKVNIIDYLATPENVLNRVGMGKEAAALRKAHENYNKELRQEIGRLAKWMDQAPDEGSSQRIFKFLDGQKDVQLSPNEEKVAGEIKSYLKDWANRLGLPEDNQISDYITHIFPKGYIEKDFDPEIAKMIDNKVAKSTYNPFLQKRLGKEGYVEDVWRALQAYIKRGVRKANMDPALEKIESASGKVDLETYKYIQRHISTINLRPSEIDNLIDNLVKSSPVGYRLGQRPTMQAAKGFRQMVFRATLGLNPATAIKNLSQGANTYAKLGEKYTVIGYADFIKRAVQKDLTELYQEGVLDDGFIQDRMIGVHKSLIQKLDPTLFALFDTAEKINRGTAYFGAKKKALAEGKSVEQAVDYAKKVVRETQFNYDAVDTPVGLSVFGDLGKLFTQFQTFTLKQGEFLIGMLKNKEWAGLVRYLAATFAFMFSVGKLIGYRLDDIIPSVRFESPFTQFLGTGKKILSTDEDVRRQGVRELPRLAALMVPGGSQAKKTIEGLTAVKEGASLTPTGRTRFEVEDTFANTIRAALFGQWNLPGAREYIKNMDVAKSEQVIKELKDMSRTEASEALAKIKTENPSLYSSIEKATKDKELGVTKKEKEIRGLPVNDGSRARRVVKELDKKKSTNEKKALLKDWIEKGIITETVAEQLAEMRRLGQLRL